VLEIIRPGVLGKAKLAGFRGFLHEVGLPFKCSKLDKYQGLGCATMSFFCLIWTLLQLK